MNHRLKSIDLKRAMSAKVRRDIFLELISLQTKNLDEIRHNATRMSIDIANNIIMYRVSRDD